MRQPNNSNPGSVSQLPQVTLITCGYKDIQQTYKNIDHIIIEDLAPPIAFNEGIQSSNNSILGFLDQYSDFASENVVDTIVQVFLQYPEFGGVYTDHIFNSYQQYYPSYFYKTLQNIVINTPFFCRKETNVKFNPDNMSYYYDALKTIGQHAILHHIPEPLFIINNGTSN